MKFKIQNAKFNTVCSVCILHFAFCITGLQAADKEYTVKGMVLRADPANRSFVVSHEKIVGLMDSMIMPFDVRDAKDLAGVVPGAVVEFTLVVGDKCGVRDEDHGRALPERRAGSAHGATAGGDAEDGGPGARSRSRSARACRTSR